MGEESDDFECRTVTSPRLCFMKLEDIGYGFNLHGEKGVPGQYISAVDLGGAADKAGLRCGDRVVEVNGVNVENLKHSDVVHHIRLHPTHACLLVVDGVTDEYLKSIGRSVTSDLAGLTSVQETLSAEESEVDEDSSSKYGYTSCDDVFDEKSPSTEKDVLCTYQNIKEDSESEKKDSGDESTYENHKLDDGDGNSCAFSEESFKKEFVENLDEISRENSEKIFVRNLPESRSFGIEGNTKGNKIIESSESDNNKHNDQDLYAVVQKKPPPRVALSGNSTPCSQIVEYTPVEEEPEPLKVENNSMERSESKSELEAGSSSGGSHSSINNMSSDKYEIKPLPSFEKKIPPKVKPKRHTVKEGDWREKKAIFDKL